MARRTFSLIQTLWLPLTLVLLLAACAGADTTEDEPPVEQAPPPSAEEEFEELVADGHRHFEARDDYEKVDAALQSWQEAVAIDDLSDISDRDRASVHRAMAQAHYFKARFHGTDGGPITPDADLAAQAQSAHDAAIAALNLEAPQFHAAVERGAPFEDDLVAPDPEAADSLLWYALTLDLLAHAEGMSAVVSAQPVVDTIMNNLRDEAPELYAGAAHRYFGVRWITRPFHRSPEDSAESFAAAIDEAPEFLLNHFYQAIYLTTATGTEAEYEAQLQQIIDGPETTADDWAPENAIVQRWAEEWLARSDEFFD